MERSEKSFQKLVLVFHHGDSRVQTQVLKLSSNRLYSLSSTHQPTFSQSIAKGAVELLVLLPLPSKT